MLDSLRRVFIMAHSAKNTRPPEPIRIPRPWDRQEKVQRRGTPLAEMIRQMRIPVRPSTPEGEVR